MLKRLQSTVWTKKRKTLKNCVQLGHIQQRRTLAALRESPIGRIQCCLARPGSASSRRSDQCSSRLAVVLGKWVNGEYILTAWRQVLQRCWQREHESKQWHRREQPYGAARMQQCMVNAPRMMQRQHTGGYFVMQITFCSSALIEHSNRTLFLATLLASRTAVSVIHSLCVSLYLFGAIAG